MPGVDLAARLTRTLRLAAAAPAAEPGLDALAASIAAAAAGQVAPPPAVPERVVRPLAGHELALDGTLVSFGAGSQLGDVTIGDVLAPGAVKLTLQLQPADARYDLAGRPSPFVGLRSYTYADQARYGGRVTLADSAAERIAREGEQLGLCFVVGASGSGKSSFVRAALIPALERHYGAAGHTMRHAVCVPGAHPLAALAGALARLGASPPADLARAAPEEVAQATAAGLGEARGALLIDQFEELFTQAEAGERQQTLALIAGLRSFRATGVHIIATLRADFLPDLFPHTELYAVAREAIELRPMTPDELREAILQPLRALPAEPPVAMDPALLERLVADVGADAGALPLLQIALEQIARGGVLDRRGYGGLAAALEGRAEELYALRRVGARIEERPRPEGEALLALCVDLVRVSLDDDPRRDARRRVPLAALTAGDPRRVALVEELVAGRLLVAESAAPPEVAAPQDDAPEDEAPEAAPEQKVVTLAHEALLAHWRRLSDAVTERREDLRRRERFLIARDAWQRAGQAHGYLLTGAPLAEAEALERSDDLALRDDQSRAFLAASRQADAARRRSERLLRGLALAVVAALALGALALLANRLRLDRLRSAAATVELGPVPGAAASLERFEVTNGRYAACVAAAICGEPEASKASFDEPETPEWARLPVTGVELEQAQAFCAWIGRRLPNAAEWQAAATRGGATPWPWGLPTPRPELANLYYPAAESPARFPDPAGSAPAGATPGERPIDDLAGNVREWVILPEPSHLDNTAGVAGGSFTMTTGAVDLLAGPYALSPDDSFDDVGFRCAADG